MGNRAAYLDQAVLRLKEHPRIANVQASSWLETAPWGNTDQDAFLNGALKVITDLMPEELLDYMQQLEQEAGRERKIHWGPRTLDLDIIWWEEQPDDTANEKSENSLADDADEKSESEGVSHESQHLTFFSNRLTIPHPYFWERSFVLLPLKELYPQFTYKNQSIDERLKEI